MIILANIQDVVVLWKTRCMPGKAGMNLLSLHPGESTPLTSPGSTAPFSYPEDNISIFS